MSELIDVVMRRDGLVFLTDSTGGMAPAAVDDLSYYLTQHTLYNAHVKAQAKESVLGWGLPQAHGWKVASVAMEDVVLAPGFFEHVLGLYPMAKEYFANLTMPRLYSMNAFWTFPVPPNDLYMATQDWHRDQDAPVQFTVFMFGTDVFDPSDGEHQYQRGTHRVHENDFGYEFREPPPERVIHVTGARGTTLLEDTMGMHRALPPLTGPRLLLWARWSNENPPQSYHWDQLQPVAKERLGNRYPSDPELQEAIRLVVA